MQAAGGKPMVVWQIPLGNQYFGTENNTNGPLPGQPNRVLFGHLQELKASGVVGLLFGAGNSGSTVENDGRGDGISNPASFCTADGMSSGQVCNDHASTVSDDDGGYLRMQASAYFANPIPLGGVANPATSTPTPAVSSMATPSPTPTVTSVPSFTAGASVARVRWLLELPNRSRRQSIAQRLLADQRQPSRQYRVLADLQQ